MMNIIIVFQIQSPGHNQCHQPDEVIEILDWISATKHIEKESFTELGLRKSYPASYPARDMTRGEPHGGQIGIH